VAKTLPRLVQKVDGACPECSALDLNGCPLAGGFACADNWDESH